jgi:adenylate kinase
MNILLIGPQGSGKGTQARLLCDKFGFYYFESGAYLRRISETNPELKKLLDQGVLVPDKEMTSYLAAFLDSESMYDGIIFDGFPRTHTQYQFFKNWLTDKNVKIDLVIDLQIPEEETIRRLSARRQDPQTGKIYNLITDPPPSSINPEKLVHRDDDQPDAIKKRLAMYKQRTEPLIEELKRETKVEIVDGARSIEEIASDLEKIVESHK